MFLIMCCLIWVWVGCVVLVWLLLGCYELFTFDVWCSGGLQLNVVLFIWLRICVWLLDCGFGVLDLLCLRLYLLSRLCVDWLCWFVWLVWFDLERGLVGLPVLLFVCLFVTWICLVVVVVDLLVCLDIVWLMVGDLWWCMGFVFCFIFNSVVHYTCVCCSDFSLLFDCVLFDG